jgi:hypothetical protein
MPGMGPDRCRTPDGLPRRLFAAAAAVLSLGVTGCAADTGTAKPEPVASAAASDTPSPSASSSPSASATPSASSTSALSNACPDVGCQVRIASVTPAAGGELTLDFEANYALDLSHNHVHVYWDHYSAEQVSDDAETRFHVTPGDWVPTGDDPYTTAEAASVSKRGASTRICVTAGDRDHNVLDPKLFQCTDVSALV